MNMSPRRDPVTSAETRESEGGRRFSRRTALGWVGAGIATMGLGREGAMAADLAAAEVLREFIYDQAAFPSCHASTVVEVGDGLLASWFGGSAEGKPDVCIYTARKKGGGPWSVPEKVADGVVAGDGERHPCWNPVLFQPRRGPLLMFYKVGPRPSTWWGMVMTSADQGRTWSEPVRLPEGQLGPVRAKPVELEDGTLLCGSSTEQAGWQVQMEYSRDPLRSWSRTRPLNRADEWGAIQPTILLHTAADIQILCRSRQGVILESWSRDGGQSWGPMARTPLPNPSAGIDAVRLRAGGFLLIYNHTEKGRAVLNVARTPDGAKWEAVAVLEKEGGEFSYPAGIQTRDGLVHFVYTWKRRRLRHVVLDPARISGEAIVQGRWPGGA